LLLSFLEAPQVTKLQRRSVSLFYIPTSLHFNKLFIASITSAHSGRKQYRTDWRNKITKGKSRHYPILCSKHC